MQFCNNFSLLCYIYFFLFIQFPFTKIFIDTRNNDKYKTKHIAHAINVPLINDNTNDKDSNPQEILKQSLHQILKQQTYMISHVWFYGNNCDKIDSSLYIQLCETIKNIFINHDVVFFGAFATALYGQYSSEKEKIEKKPDFDIIATNPVEIIKDIKKTLSQYKIENVTSKKHNEICYHP